MLLFWNVALLPFSQQMSGKYQGIIFLWSRWVNCVMKQTRKESLMSNAKNVVIGRYFGIRNQQ